MTPVLDLTVIHLRHSLRYPDLHWGSQHLSVSLQDTVAEMAADHMVKMKSIYKVDKINTVDMRVYGADSKYLLNNPTLEEFIETGDATLFNSFRTTMYKVVLLTF